MRALRLARVLSWVCLACLLLGSVDTPLNSATAKRLMRYRIDPTVLAIVPLQPTMKADLESAGGGQPWPALLRFIEDGDKDRLPPAWPQAKGIPTDLRRLPFYNVPGPPGSFALPSSSVVREAIDGMAFAAINEIAEHPEFFESPEAEDYVSRVLDRLYAEPSIMDIAPIDQLRTMLRSRKLNSALLTAKAIRDEGASVVHHVTRPFLIGNLTTQCAYNAAVVHDVQLDAAMRQHIANQNVWDITTPDGKSWKAGLAAIPQGHWSAIYESCRLFVRTLIVTGTRL